LGWLEAAAGLYRERYQPAFQIYHRSCDPKSSADIVLDNTVFADAVITAK
jgi:hypothetical protein